LNVMNTTHHLYIYLRHLILMAQKPQGQLNVATRRIEELFNQAASTDDPIRAKRYVTIARAISMKYRIRLGREYKRKFCKSCNAFLKIGKNCTVRLVNGKKVTRCLECGKVRRIVYK
jgi:ribonuclease P protein subunit RPR2